MTKWQIKLVIGAVSFVFILIILLITLDFVRVKGDEIGVLETYAGGVYKEPLTPRTYMCWPWEKVYRYPTSEQVFVMNDKPEDATGDKTNPIHGRKLDSYLVQSKDQQDMHISLQVQFRLDPSKIIQIHQKVRSDLEEKVLRPILLGVVKNQATVRNAIEAYSGEGLVQLQKDIKGDLDSASGELKEYGVTIDNFVIEHIGLEPKYVEEITARQIAVQRELRAKQEEKANIALAATAKAAAQADYEKRVVEANRDKQVQVLSAEAEQQKMILAAEGDKQRVVLAAEGEKNASELKASAILAVGKANAESEKLRFSAYSAPGSEVYAKIQIAKSMADAFGNIKGYLPENMNIYTLGGSFLQAVDNVVGPAQAGIVPLLQGNQKVTK